MTEWELQRALTRHWVEDCAGRIELADQRFYLAAGEVMTDYEINDARRHFSKPSIDFLLLDADGRPARGDRPRQRALRKHGIAFPISSPGHDEWL